MFGKDFKNNGKTPEGAQKHHDAMGMQGEKPCFPRMFKLEETTHMQVTRRPEAKTYGPLPS